ncbi:MAG: 16S rRNA (cytosine(967)-C(5))-methyltransferase RsmB [Deltaproteobacteria bacterium]|nr:16S rRNA (cytosine(967)-C(5))-methyltransferase RsmB [Deltaproteobacteria bacterium]
MINARSLALQVLLSWHRTGTYPDQLMRDWLAKNPRIRSVDRSLVYQLVYGVLRWQGKIDWTLKQFSQIALEKLSLRTLFILRLGVFQLLMLSRIPVSAAVNESVKLAKSGPEPWTANFINAVLRSLDRGRDGLSFPSREDPVSYLAVNYSHPVRLVEHWIAVFGFEKTLALCDFNNQIPPYTIRVNTAKITRPQLIKRLEPKALGVEVTPFSTVGIRLEKPKRPLIEDDLHQQGFFQIQDEASQMIAPILAPRPGERVLDLCAGAGGKTGHLAQLMKNQGNILAVDLHPKKIKALMENAERLGFNIIQCLAGDGLKEDLFSEAAPVFDRILIDAPCSGWGVMGRNPDLKWRIGPEDGTRLAQRQNKFLQNGAGWLKSKGVLVYCTCTLNREENQEVIQNFLLKNPEFLLENVSSFLPDTARGLIDRQGCYQTWPPTHRMDGFFAARLRKTG